MGTITEDRLVDLVDEIASSIEEHGDYDSWKPETRRSWQDMVLLRVRNELDAREEWLS